MKPNVLLRKLAGLAVITYKLYNKREQNKNILLQSIIIIISFFSHSHEIVDFINYLPFYCKDY